MLKYFVTIGHWQGRQNSVREGGALKELRAMKTYVKQEIVTTAFVSTQQQC